MSLPPSGSSSIALVNLGIKVYEITGIKKQVVRFFTGKTIVIAGLAGAGKTTFLNYLKYGIFDDESRHIKTIRVEGTPTFAIQTGRNGSLEVDITTAIEVPGQYPPEEHAVRTREYVPHALLIFADAGKLEESYEWIEEFCNAFEDQWRGKRNNKIQSIIVVLNKQEKLPPDTIDTALTKLRNLVSEKLQFARGELFAEIKSLPCTMVSNPDNSKYIDSLITKLALDLQR
jgi:GTPase SAR1 family protein